MRLQIVHTTTSTVGDVSHDDFLILFDEVDDLEEMAATKWADFMEKSGAKGILAFSQKVEVVR
jgi:hypothetical protein